MALKAFLNGTKYNLSKRGKSPSIFVNGTKKSLSVGLTFINGQKHVLWDSRMVLNMDIIPLPSASQSRVLWVGDNKVICCRTNNEIREYDITDPGSVSETGKYTYGNMAINAPAEEVNNNVFYIADNTTGRLPSSQILYNLIVNKVVISDDGTISIPEAKTIYSNQASSPFVGTSALSAKVNGSWENISWGIGSMAVYNGTSLAYNVFSSGSYAWETIYDSHFVKYDDSGILGTKTNTEVKSNIYLFGVNSYSTEVTNLGGAYNSVLIDGQNIIIGTSATDTLNGSFEINGVGSEVATNSNKRIYKVMGKIGLYYIVLDIPYNTASSDQECYLELFDESCSLFNSYILPVISGISDMKQVWRDCTVMPITSRNGYLGGLLRNGTDRYLFRVQNG